MAIKHPISSCTVATDFATSARIYMLFIQHDLLPWRPKFVHRNATNQAQQNSAWQRSEHCAFEVFAQRKADANSQHHACEQEAILIQVVFVQVVDGRRSSRKHDSRHDRVTCTKRFVARTRMARFQRFTTGQGAPCPITPCSRVVSKIQCCNGCQREESSKLKCITEHMRVAGGGDRIALITGRLQAIVIINLQITVASIISCPSVVVSYGR